MDKMELARQAMARFLQDETILSLVPFGSGHINDTYLVEAEKGEARRRLVLQRINHQVMKNPEQVMENMEKVTAHLCKKILAAGGDCDRETLTVLPAADGKPFYRDGEGSYYRVCKLIADAVSYDKAETKELFYESAVAFGRFMSQLADFPAAELHETIPGFHDTAKRFARFCQVAEEDKLGRAAGVQKEIAFIKDHACLAQVLGKKLASGELPLRVTHNDTKLNNVMLDARTGRAVCVIDLDTVMPGLAVNDFGDSIRFGASTAAEDETDLSRVECSMELFDVYTRGYLEGCRGGLTGEEIKALPLGAMVMTYESGIRFLTDYLEGDVYFKIHREGHNLDRCRTQLKLVHDMEQKRDQMDAIVEKYQ